MSREHSWRRHGSILGLLSLILTVLILVLSLQGDIHKSRDRLIAGVAGGLAEHYGWDKTTVRVVWAVSVVAAGVGIMPYVVGWIFMPPAPEIRDT